MCLSLRHLEWAGMCRKLAGAKEVKKAEDAEPGEKKKTPKFPSRERNHAVRRRKTNNNTNNHNCECCAITNEQQR
ncbi:hypothetical protein EVAR_59674_1 [Eumeta japonica]|uniref:Uncharacterized protein n=1 Tax=Eumeta variegata TaxID=151549 RepID=A0A4C1ZJU8_EUMVA|nr:hypothetical protein EVAR_59674_1 [Eumeta japonica]